MSDSISHFEIINRESINVLLGTHLIPWAHGFEEDRQKVIKRINELRKGKQLILSIDSIRPSDLILPFNSMIPHGGLSSIYPDQNFIINGIEVQEGDILIGSDPLSFMIGITSKNENPINLLEIYAKIVAGMILGGTSFEVSARFLLGNELNLKTPSRRDFFRLSGILGAATVAGVASRFIPLSEEEGNHSEEADEIFEGRRVGSIGKFSTTKGIDERTLLDAFKHRKITEVLEKSNYLDRSDYVSISVWGNDHFLTDDYDKLPQIAAEDGVDQRYLENGREWLMQVIPRAHETFIKQGGEEALFLEFTQKAYDDLEKVSAVRIEIQGENRILKPVDLGGVNYLNISK